MMEVNQYSSINILWYTLGIVVLLWIFQLNWNRRWLYYYASKLNGPFALPFIGSIYIFYRGRKGALEVYMNILRKYGPIMKFWLGSKLLIAVTEPKDVVLVLSTSLGKSDLYVEYGKRIVGEGLVTAPVEKWRRHRKIINLTFSQNILNSYIDIFIKHADDLVQQLKKSSGEVELFPYFSQSALGIIIDTCMGVNFCEMEERNNYASWIMKYGQLVIRIAVNPLTKMAFLTKYSSVYNEAMTLCEKAWNFIRKIVEKKRSENIKTATSNKNNFLDHLIAITDQEGKWTNEELMEEAQTMVPAGSESTAITACFVMLMLAIHPNVQQKVYEEIFSIFENSEKTIELEDLDRMTYLECVIKETLRLFPPIPTILRSVDKNMTLGSHVIPKGSDLVIPIIFIHRDPKYWPNPLKFDPTRFFPDEIAKQERCSFMPFSIPPRNCIGMKFSMMSMKVVLATVLRYFTLNSCQYGRVTDIELSIDVALTATRGYRVSLESR